VIRLIWAELDTPTGQAGPLSAPTYMSDGLHINATGGARYGSYVADGLLRLARAGMLGA